MIPFPALPELTDGDRLSAGLYMKVLARRNHWLYGHAHAVNGLQRVAECVSTGDEVVWTGETPYRSQHPTINFSARINISSGAGARLDYYNSSGTWTNIATDANTGDRWFNGVENNTFDASGYSLPADGILVLRFSISVGSALVYRAYMSGTTGFATWPGTLPTFVDGAGNEPDEDDFNALRSMGEYLNDCAEKPRLGTAIGTGSHTQTDAYEPLYQWTFTYTGTQKLVVNLDVADIDTGDHVYVYLNNEKYPSSGSRLATLADITSNGNHSADYDLSTLGLSKGTRYQVEIGTYNSGANGATVTVNNVILGDLVGATRTYSIKGDWEHSDRPTAAQLNAVTNDLNQMYPASDRESPIFSSHLLAPWQLTVEEDGGTGISTYHYSAHGIRLCHVHRYLRYRGAGKIISLDGANEVSLSDTEPSGGPQVFDLDSIKSWLPYGEQYLVQDSDSNHIVVAYEDYQ